MATKLTTRQTSVRSAVSSLKKAGTTFVTEYFGTLTDYWTKDSCSTDCIEFLLNELEHQGMPRYLEASRKLLALYTPVEVAHSKKDGFKVTNRKGVTKKQKEAMQAALAEVPEMNSILNHPSLKVSVEFQWNDNAKASTRAYMKRRLEAGVPVQELLGLMHQAAKDVAKDQAEDAAKVQEEA